MSLCSDQPALGEDNSVSPDGNVRDKMLRRPGQESSHMVYAMSLYNIGKIIQSEVNDFLELRAYIMTRPSLL